MVAFVRSFAAAGLVALALSIAMPGAPPVAQVETLTPTACAVEPGTAEAIPTVGAAATPTPESIGGTAAGGDRDDLPAALPQGDPADPETVVAITAAALEFAGCLNTNDPTRWLALTTDRLAAQIVRSAGGDGPDFAAALGSENIPRTEITTVRVRDLRVLADGRVGAVVVWRADDAKGGYPIREARFHVFARAADRWLLDEEIGGNLEERNRAGPPDGDAATQPLDDDEIRDLARSGFGEVDSAVYAEPTAMGAELLVEALVMVGFERNDDSGGIGCELFIIERGATSVTASAFCRADEALVGRPAYLRAAVSGPRRASDTFPNECEDVAQLAATVAFACTVELPEAAR